MRIVKGTINTSIWKPIAELPKHTNMQILLKLSDGTIEIGISNGWNIHHPSMDDTNLEKQPKSYLNLTEAINLLLPK